MSKSPSSNKAHHNPIMTEEVLEAFSPIALRTFYEGTVGAGGHAEAILQAHPEIERYIACDQDPDALLIAKERLAPWEDKVEYVRGNFIDLDRHLKEKGIDQVDGFFLT